MKPAILIAGSNEFKKNVDRRLDASTNSMHIAFSKQEQIAQMEAPINDANVIFLHSEPHLLPLAQFALRKAKHVVLFGAEHCSLIDLEQLLALAIESKSFLVNGDSFLFNPVIYPQIKSFDFTEITSLTSNRFRKFISRRQIFSCLEFLLYTNQSPPKEYFRESSSFK